MAENLSESVNQTAGPAEVTTASDSVPEKTMEEMLNEEILKQKEEAQRNYDNYLRALAEVENTKKRGARDREEYLKFANVNMVKKILPIIDDLHRAIEIARASRDVEALVKGVEMVASRMEEALRGEGVTAIESVGKPFDPQYHEALTVEASEEHPENTVIEQFQTGYVMHDRVIRPSLVKVSS